MHVMEEREIWGILGGMGPLASAEFLNSVYGERVNGPEQEAPTVILLSDPTMPDRTSCLLDGRQDVLLERFAGGIESLISMGATRIVVCCVTIHSLIPLLPSTWQAKIVSLLELTLLSVLQSPSKHLLFCTTGTRKLRVFQQHPLWPQAQNRIVLPDDEDQRLVHNLLYEIKGRQEVRFCIPVVENLMKKYRVSSYVAGCTEMHILAKAHEQFRGRDRREFCIDPLTEILPMIQQHAALPARAE